MATGNLWVYVAERGFLVLSSVVFQEGNQTMRQKKIKGQI